MKKPYHPDNSELFPGFNTPTAVFLNCIAAIRNGLVLCVWATMVLAAGAQERVAISKFMYPQPEAPGLIVDGTTSGHANVGTIGTNSVPKEPLGPCSRRTQLVISEIMTRPAPRADGRRLQYVELYNSNPWWEDISGYQLAGDIYFTFPTNTILPGGGFLVVAAAPEDLRTVYGITNVIGPFIGVLKTEGLLQLLDNRGAIFLEIPYSNQPPWPVAAQQSGHSLVLARPSYGEADPRAWAISDVVGGSPGGYKVYHPSPLRNVVINEMAASTIEMPRGYLELYNHSLDPVDISGSVLTDDPTTNRFVIPANTTIAGGGFVSFEESQLGFHFKATGANIFFVNPDGTRVLDAASYEPQAPEVSWGRWPDGAEEFYSLAAPTPGAPNGKILIQDVVLNEIMYNPISGDDDDQYVELYNKGTNSVDLSGWKFVAGINLTFPSPIILAPGGYLVIAHNQTNLFAHYTHLNSTNTLGNFGGKLSHKGGRLALAMPKAVVEPDGAGGLATNTIFVVEDEVTYQIGGRWGQWAHGGGSSLELINPNTNHRLAANWADSDETAKSAWTTLSFTGTLDNGANYSGAAIDLVQAGLLDVGECLLDNLEVRLGTNGPNLVQNGTFESGYSGWTMQGDHIRSSIETTNGLGGFQSSRSLHVRSSDGMWTGANSAQGTLTGTRLTAGQTATLRLTGRWLKGSPEVLMRVRGNWIELTGALSVPANLGTPGLPNSRAAANPAPAIYDVKHSPSIPPASQPVVVTARFHDATPFTPALLYRIDKAVSATPAYQSVPMLDDGTGGDAVPGDGIYSATIPAQVRGTVVAFIVQARDVSGSTAIFPAALQDNINIPRECVVMFGDTQPSGTFGHYHIWLTQNWINRWASLPALSNENHDSTFVDGGGRIIYNMAGRFAGSPYHPYSGSPVSTIGGMRWTMPEDDKMLGSASFNKQHVPGNGPFDDTTLQREQTSYWMARQIGLPWNYRRFYILYVNGNRHGPLMEDSQVPSGDFLKEHFPNDSNGFLYKNNSWFEFDANGQSFANNSWCTLNRHTTTINGTQQHKLARYRWNYWIRQSPDSANNYTNVFALIDAANTPASNPAYYANWEALVDTEQWLRVAAIEHATGDWDSIFCRNQWNMYVYKPLQGKWKALKWDWNIGLGTSGSWGPDAANLFTVTGVDPQMSAFLNYPPYLRTYLRNLKEIADLAMNNTRVDPILDAKYAAFVANGLTSNSYNGIRVSDPGTDGLKNWIRTMHTSLLNAPASMGLANIRFVVYSITNYSTDNNLITLTGAAPLEVKTIKINGVEYPLTWTSVSNWRIRLPVIQSTNVLFVQAYDTQARPLSTFTNTIVVNYTGILQSAPGKVVINEVMSKPRLPGAEFVELYNTATNFAFDLSGWQIQGLNYTFPAGAMIQAGSYLVLARNRLAFSAAYGGSVVVFDQFNANLQADGESLSLIQPGPNPSQYVLIDKMKFEAIPPWPALTNGAGASLQLVDPQQDHSRPCNWAYSTKTNSASALASPGATNVLAAILRSIPPLWLNEVQPINLNGLTNSSGQRSPWIELYNSGTNVIALDGFFLTDNYLNLTRWAFPAGASINPGEFKVIFVDGETQPSDSTELHASFRITGSTGSIALTRMGAVRPEVLDYLNYSGIRADGSYGSLPDGQLFTRQEFDHPSPGSSNDSTPPLLLVITQRNTSQWTLSWPGAIGLRYQAQYKDDLSAPGWTPIGLVLAGTGGILEFDIDMAQNRQRFFRIVALE